MEIFYILSEGYFNNWAYLLSLNLVEAVQENTFYYFLTMFCLFFFIICFLCLSINAAAEPCYQMFVLLVPAGHVVFWPSNFIGYVP